MWKCFYEIDKHCVRIGVKDTGRGIPQNMLEKIFERFEKVDFLHKVWGWGYLFVNLLSIK